ncbi:MAG: M4 family metallopeptidase [Bacteroidales bacterium]|nr:M4 family metallopeptidase [Bacteroidales bacterium]
MRGLLIVLLILTPILIKGQDKEPELIPEKNASTVILDDQFVEVDGRTSGNASSSFINQRGKPLNFTTAVADQQPDEYFRNRSPLYIERDRPQLKSERSTTPREQFGDFIKEFREVTGDSPEMNFRITGSETDRLGITHIRAVKQHKGIDIYGSESTLHIDLKKERFTGTVVHIDAGLAAMPYVDTGRVIRIIEEDLRKITLFRELSPAEKTLLKYHGPRCSLVYYDRYYKHYRLTWEVSIRPNLLEEWKYFVDALTGTIIHKYNNTQSDGPAMGVGVDLNGATRTFDVYLMEEIYYMYNVAESMFDPVTDQGFIVTLDANNTSTFVLDFSYITSTNNTWTHQAAISAHCNAEKTYTYFDTTFNWKSFNGKGGNILSIVNIAEEDGTSMENAFWNGQAVFYGNGGANFKPLAGALDVTAHELGHAVVSATANLEYYGQPGAINEAYADIFACMVDRTDWQIGEDVTRPGYAPSGAARDLSNPHNMGDSTKPYWQPAHMTEIFLGTRDNGGVHINSGIINYAYYLYATSIGKNKAEQVFFRALTNYLTKTSGFIELRLAVIFAARDLFGDFSHESTEAEKAFEQVGIYEEELFDDPQVFDTNPGTEYLLTYDTSPSDPVSLYMSSAIGTDYQPITRTAMKGKVSVTDNGTSAVFVSNDYRLRMIDLDPAKPNERFISGSSYYDHVAISKDGKRIAATKAYLDASIYVIDLISGQGLRYILYNPTTGNDGNASGGVIKANSVEFDVTGEYLIYDCYNVINSSSQKDIYYWDIGFIKVWDNQMNDFGDGTISKLFNSLPAGVSVANPVFSKNSPNIVAFDYIFENGLIEEHSIYAANIETGEMNLIIRNDREGFPSFSNNDDQIAYSSVNDFNMQVVKSMKLRSDKITPVGDAGVLVPDAKWPVYYATGLRTLGLVPVANFTADYRAGGLPLHVRFMDLSANKPTSWLWVFEGGNPDTSDLQNPEVTFAIPGTYKVKLIATNSFGENHVIKEGYIHAYDATDINPEEQNPFNIYPNPVTGMLKIEYDQPYRICIFNLQGVQLFSGTNDSVIDLSLWPSGIYILELTTKQGRYWQKLLKR